MEPTTGRTAPTDLYAREILRCAPRVLSRIDREAASPTAGCGDRTFWAWKFTDFAGSRFQEAVCVLGYLYATPLPGSPYHGNARLLAWIASAIRYWASLQHADGSFDEAYPFERSLAATAFTSFYVGEGLGFVGDALDGETRATARATLIRAGEWLCANDEHHGFLSNHLAAAAAALRQIHRVSGDERFERRSRYFIDKILARQSDEGWYDEYGGADIGYQTHGSFYLARCLELKPESDLRASLGRAMTFIAHFVHPDGSMGGEYASRNTQTYYPAAFEMFAGESAAASWIADRMRASVPTAAAAGVSGIDAYNLYPMLNNLVFAHRACAAGTERREPQEPSHDDRLIWFPQAGLARVRRDAYDAYVGVTKGGVTKVFDRTAGRLVYSDCGFVGARPGGGLVTTQQQDGARAGVVADDRIELEGALFAVKRPVMSPFRFMAFRLFSLTAGRVPFLARWLKHTLVKVLIYRKESLPVLFRRTLEFSDDRVVVRDRFEGDPGSGVDAVRRVPVFTSIHMGSARYFVANDLAETTDGAAEDTASAVAMRAGVTLEKAIPF